MTICYVQSDECAQHMHTTIFVPSNFNNIFFGLIEPRLSSICELQSIFVSGRKYDRRNFLSNSRYIKH